MLFIKNIKYFFVLSSLALFLAACGDKENSKTFVLDNDIANIEVTNTYKGDKVIKQNTKITLFYTKLNMTKEQVEQQFTPLVKQYEGITGIDNSVEYKDDAVIEITSVDYTKADLKKLAKLSGPNYAGDAIKNMSVKQAEDFILKQGFIEKK